MDYLRAKELKAALEKVEDSASIAIRSDRDGVARKVIVGVEGFIIIAD